MQAQKCAQRHETTTTNRRHRLMPLRLLRCSFKNILRDVESRSTSEML